MLGCYVYRLIDPRNGVTFYVGRGRGDRVFSHAAGEEKPTDSEDADSLKIRLIRAIKADGFQVEHVIHRHGMNEEAAKEVEAALIDAYPGLTNNQRGSDSQRGVMHATQVIHFYEAEEAKFQHRVILFDVSHSVEDRPTIDAVRYAWRVALQRARKAEYVLAVRYGVIVGVYVPEDWLPATPENFPGFPLVEAKKFGFRAKEAQDEVKAAYLQKRAPLRKRGDQSGFHYEGPW
jgi:hypothetical protein